MDTLLQLASSSDRRIVSAEATRLSEAACGWCDGAYAEALGPRLVDTVSLTVATIAPWLAYDKLELLVRYSLWCCLVDEQLDATDVEQHELDHIAASVRAVLRGTRLAMPGDVTEVELDRVLSGFCAYGRGDGLMSPLIRAIEDGVTAAIEHSTLSRGIRAGIAVPPTADEYLAVASRHIRYRGFALGLLLLGGAAPVPSAMDAVNRALSHGSVAVRLVNDLRTEAKDAREGSLNLLALHPGLPRSRVLADVERMVEDNLRAHDELLDSAYEDGLSKSAVLILTNSLRVCVGLYRITDLTQEEPWPS